MSPSEESSTAQTTTKKATYSLAALKILELCLIICCIGLIDEPSNYSHIRIFITPRTVGLCYVTFGALLIYTTIYLIMRLFGEVTGWKTSSLWSLLGFILFLACTSVLFRDWANVKDRNYWHPNTHRLDMVCAAGSVSIIAALIFLIDLILTLRFGIKGDIE